MSSKVIQFPAPSAAPMRIFMDTSNAAERTGMLFSGLLLVRDYLLESAAPGDGSEYCLQAIEECCAEFGHAPDQLNALFRAQPVPSIEP